MELAISTSVKSTDVRVRFKEFRLRRNVVRRSGSNPLPCIIIIKNNLKTFFIILDDENNIIECCHYTNFQPLLIEDNLKKSNKWSDIDELYWRQNIIFNDDFKQLYIPS